MELGFDERAKAEAMSYRFRTEQYETVLKAGDMERCLPALVWHLEDPRVGQSYPNYYISRLASKFVKVALSGAGGDELFAGYPWRYYRAVVNDGFDDYVEKYYRFWHRLIPNAVVQDFFAPEIWRRCRDIHTIDIFRAVLPDSGHHSLPEEYVNHSLYLEAKTFLHGLLLVDDKLSMAHGLETRVPFLDNDLVDFAQRVPVRLKLRDLDESCGSNENEPGRQNDPLLRAHARRQAAPAASDGRHVPKHVTDQVKQGFSGPDAAGSAARASITSGASFWTRTPRFTSISSGHCPQPRRGQLDGTVNRRLLIWSLLTLSSGVARSSTVRGRRDEWRGAARTTRRALLDPSRRGARPLGA